MNRCDGEFQVLKHLKAPNISLGNVTGSLHGGRFASTITPNEARKWAQSY
jgi:hypothetical protein